MPRIALTKEQKIEKQLNDLTHEIDLALYDAKIPKKAVAEAAGVDSSAVSHQFRKGRITMSVYLAAQMLLEAK